MKATTIDNVTGYLQQVFKLGPMQGGARCYRGQSNAIWPLKPSIMRGNVRPNAENRVFSELMLEEPSEFQSDKSMFDKLVRAQHYGLPTRLLDVSLNPLVGLYFACNEFQHHDKDGAVNVFDFEDTRVKFADSDAVSLICNLARLSDKERDAIHRGRDKSSKTLSKAFDRKTFRSMPAVERLLQFVRVEKPYFLNLVEPIDLFRYFFVHPAKSNRRVVAQSGAFIAAGLLRYEAPQRSSGFRLHTIIVPASKKSSILHELDLININSRTMFPEVEFASKYIKAKWTTD